MELRSAAKADIQIYAIGLDLGGMALEVAERGFSSMLSNRMGQLGRWSFDGARPAVRLADDLIVHLLERERSSRFERAVIGVAVPVWLGIHERTHLADVIDPRRRHSLVSCSTTTAAVVGSSLAADSPLRAELVLCLDLEVGCSASIVEIAPAMVREWCSVGLSPDRLRGDAVGAGIVPGTRQRELAITDLIRESFDLGCADIDRVVVVGDESLDDVRSLLAAATSATSPSASTSVPDGPWHAASWSTCPIELVRGRSLVARGAAFLADPDGGVEVFDIGPESGTVASSGSTGSSAAADGSTPPAVSALDREASALASSESRREVVGVSDVDSAC